MSRLAHKLPLAVVLLLLWLVGCEDVSDSHLHGGHYDDDYDVFYGPGHYAYIGDEWYYVPPGGYYRPGQKPGHPNGPDHPGRPGAHPEHPIAHPGVTRPSRPATRPAGVHSTPGIPSRARPSGGRMGGARMGGGGRRR